MCCISGWGEAIRIGWPDVWWVPGSKMWRQVCPVLLCKCDVPAVLLWILLGTDPLPTRPRVPQATSQGGSRSTTCCAISLVLTSNGSKAGWTCWPFDYQLLHRAYAFLLFIHFFYSWKFSSGLPQLLWYCPWSKRQPLNWHCDNCESSYYLMTLISWKWTTSWWLFTKQHKVYLPRLQRYREWGQIKVIIWYNWNCSCRFKWKMSRSHDTKDVYVHIQSRWLATVVRKSFHLF